MFIWDTQKAIINLEKHKVSFEEAVTTFADEIALDWEDKMHSQHEQRFKHLGLSIFGRVLMVVYTVRSSNGKEAIRIISARAASQKERKAYQG